MGPCTDTDDDAWPLVSGTASWQGNDHDFLRSGTRGNASGHWGCAELSDDAGNEYSYSWRFHVNDRCHAPEDGPPSCLIERATLEMK